MQTEDMIGRATPRIRHTDRDNAPTGRDVHWSMPVRLELAALATLLRWSDPQLGRTRALERAALWSGPVLLAMLLVLATLLVMRGGGGMAGGLMALGLVGTAPAYQAFAAGNIDHHALALALSLLAVLLPVLGGAGFVCAPHLPEARARAWFVAGGVAGGLGLWVSAASVLPVLVGLTAGAVLTGILLRNAPRPEHWNAAPTLWRAWGLAGGVTSIIAYIIEYFPGHLALRLEVNHPLYALAWFAAGDLAARLSRPLTVRDRPWLSGDVLLLSLPVLTILVGGATVFQPADPLLWSLHHDFILEFRSIGYHFSRLNAWHLAQGTTSVLPLLLLPLAALAWRTSLRGPRRFVWRGFCTLAILAALAFAHTLLFPTFAGLLRTFHLLPNSPRAANGLVHVLSLLGDAAICFVFFIVPRRRLRNALTAPVTATLVVATVPAMLLLALAFEQIRWLGQALLLLLAAGVGCLAVLRSDRQLGDVIRPIVVATIALTCVPFIAINLVAARSPQHALQPADAATVIARDVAYQLRDRLGTRTGTVLSDPTSSLWLGYYGDLRAVGTLYWENRDGLMAAARIYGAPDAATAKAALDGRGVTHVVVFSWEPFLREYAGLAGTNGETSFLARLVAGEPPPAWLKPVPYSMPAGFGDTRVWIYERVGP